VTVRSLIVDDNAFFLEAAGDLLRREGLDVVGVASTGVEAIRLVRKLRPDVVLVDVDLGTEDGFELARELIEVSRKQTKVILVSTHPEVELSELISASPAVGFIHKTRLSGDAVRKLIEPAND
jgi:two-component system, NarL family, nitrate/nitrite response regulator NarL